MVLVAKEELMSNLKMHTRPAEERGVADFGWLSSRHSFSFGHYYDPEHKGFRALRVINDDRVQPGQGFGTHPHRDLSLFRAQLTEGARIEHSIEPGRSAWIQILLRPTPPWGSSR